MAFILSLKSSYNRKQEPNIRKGKISSYKQLLQNLG